jgi:hypothetical protein
MNDTDNKIKITFAPGCFDNFDGSQEELDELIKEITRLAESGELLENSKPVEIPEDFDFDDVEIPKRNLQ